MPTEIRVEGADKLRLVARTLRDLGDKDFRRQLFRGLNRATKPLKEAARVSAATRLPRRGGLALKVSKSRLSTRNRTGRNPSVRIEAKGITQLKLMDEGRVRHPVFNTGQWVWQEIPPRWFTRPMLLGQRPVRREINNLLDELAEEAARRIRRL